MISIEILRASVIITYEIDSFTHIIAGIWPASFYRIAVNNPTMSGQWEDPLMVLLKPLTPDAWRSLLHSNLDVKL